MKIQDFQEKFLTCLLAFQLHQSHVGWNLSVDIEIVDFMFLKKKKQAMAALGQVQGTQFI